MKGSSTSPPPFGWDDWYASVGAFVPGKISDVKFTMNDVAHTFKKGHRIMVQIQSSWFPLVDRNPQKMVDIYTCSDQDFQKATIKIYHDPANASFLVLPVLH
jgi:hypothetical protein